MATRWQWTGRQRAYVGIVVVLLACGRELPPPTAAPTVASRDTPQAPATAQLANPPTATANEATFATPWPARVPCEPFACVRLEASSPRALQQTAWGATGQWQAQTMGEVQAELPTLAAAARPDRLTVRLDAPLAADDSVELTASCASGAVQWQCQRGQCTPEVLVSGPSEAKAPPSARLTAKTFAEPLDRALCGRVRKATEEGCRGPHAPVPSAVAEEWARIVLEDAAWHIAAAQARKLASTHLLAVAEQLKAWLKAEHWEPTGEATGNVAVFWNPRLDAVETTIELSERFSVGDTDIELTCQSEDVHGEAWCAVVAAVAGVTLRFYAHGDGALAGGIEEVQPGDHRTGPTHSGEWLAYPGDEPKRCAMGDDWAGGPATLSVRSKGLALALPGARGSGGHGPLGK